MASTENITINITRDTASKSSASKWAEAIEDAEGELRELKLRTVRLKAVIEIFKERLEQGAPFPGEGITA